MITRTRFKTLCFNLAALLCASLLFNGLSSVSYAETTAATEAGDTAATADELFTARDLKQIPDLSEATELTVVSGQDITISNAGIYLLRGTAADATVIVESDKEAKVQLVLDGVSITNKDFPAIYVKSADKVFVTVYADSDLSVTGSFRKDGSTNTDAVIFSKEDLVLNGTAVLNVASTGNGIVSKDDLKVTGGTYNITASSKALEVKDSILIHDGIFHLEAGTDGLHAENNDDNTRGNIIIQDGTFEINAGDDGIHANATVTIEDGSFNIISGEGIESTCVLISGGTFRIESQDDGINAANKSSAYRPAVEISGGEITITMGAGDTDGIDTNGDLIITGGTINVTGNSAFDVDGSITFTGGTVIINGQQVDSIPNQMMGGPGFDRGGFGGQGGFGNQGGMDQGGFSGGMGTGGMGFGHGGGRW